MVIRPLLQCISLLPYYLFLIEFQLDIGTVASRLASFVPSSSGTNEPTLAEVPAPTSHSDSSELARAAHSRLAEVALVLKVYSFELAMASRLH